MCTSSNEYSNRNYKLDLTKMTKPKAALFIDMPNSCKDCPLFNDFYTDMSCGALNDRTINYPVPDSSRMDWCPLVPLSDIANDKQEFTYREEDVENILSFIRENLKTIRFIREME